MAKNCAGNYDRGGDDENHQFFGNLLIFTTSISTLDGFGGGHLCVIQIFFFLLIGFLHLVIFAVLMIF